MRQVTKSRIVADWIEIRMTFYKLQNIRSFIESLPKPIKRLFVVPKA